MVIVGLWSVERIAVWSLPLSACMDGRERERERVGLLCNLYNRLTSLFYGQFINYVNLGLTRKILVLPFTKKLMFCVFSYLSFIFPTVPVNFITFI